MTVVAPGKAVGSNSSDPVNVRTLLCHRDVDLAIHCLGSLCRCSADPVALVVHEDGSLTDGDRERLGLALPGSRVLRRSDADEQMAERLAGHPHARAFREGSVWGLKLLDVALAEPGDCYYLDGDVRFCRPFRGLFCREAVAGRSIFLRDVVWMAYSVRPWHLLGPRGLRIAEGINTGVTLIDRALYDLDYVDWFLAQPDWRVIPAWTEPTCWASLALRANGHAIDPRQLPNLYPETRVGPETLGGHFLSAYRRHFSEFLLSSPAGGPAVEVRLMPLSGSGPIALGLNQLKRKAGNTFASWRTRKGA
jgi:hypothetical protein